MLPLESSDGGWQHCGADRNRRQIFSKTGSDEHLRKENRGSMVASPKRGTAPTGVADTSQTYL
jgi:hypothetical protein